MKKRTIAIVVLATVVLATVVELLVHKSSANNAGVVTVVIDNQTYVNIEVWPWHRSDDHLLGDFWSSKGDAKIGFKETETRKWKPILGKQNQILVGNWEKERLHIWVSVWVSESGVLQNKVEYTEGIDHRDSPLKVSAEVREGKIFITVSE